MDSILPLSAGCNDFVSKPFQEDTLFVKMVKYLGLQYIYAESDQASAGSHLLDEETNASGLTSENLSVMPREWMEKLHEVAGLCDEA